MNSAFWRKPRLVSLEKYQINERNVDTCPLQDDSTVDVSGFAK